MIKRDSIFKVVLIASVLILSSCQKSPNSKEDYLAKFDEFVDMIEEDYQSLSDEAWEKKDELYKKYSEKWYEEYKAQMEFKEKIRVKKNSVKYQIYRNHKNLKDGIIEGFESVLELGEDVLEVIEEKGDSILENIEFEFDTE